MVLSSGSFGSSGIGCRTSGGGGDSVGLVVGIVGGSGLGVVVVDEEEGGSDLALAGGLDSFSSVMSSLKETP